MRKKLGVIVEEALELLDAAADQMGKRYANTCIYVLRVLGFVFFLQVGCTLSMYLPRVALSLQVVDVVAGWGQERVCMCVNMPYFVCRCSHCRSLCLDMHR